MRIQFYQKGAATRLGLAVTLFIGSFLGCAQVLGVHQVEDPPGSKGSGGAGGSDQDDAGVGGQSDPTCADDVKNGLETDIDCGGDACLPCPFGKGCMNNADCSTKSCSGNVCIMAPNPAPCMPAETDGDATCNDCLKNGPETDVDCGGDTCKPCPAGKDCLNDADCVSGKCVPLEQGRATCSS